MTKRDQGNTSNASPLSGHPGTVMEYFVVCVDYDRRGREAIVDPEDTFNGALARVRQALGDGNEVSFVHRISMNEPPEDLTEEMIAAAEQAMTEAAE